MKYKLGERENKLGYPFIPDPIWYRLRPCVQTTSSNKRGRLNQAAFQSVIQQMYLPTTNDARVNNSVPNFHKKKIKIEIEEY